MASSTSSKTRRISLERSKSKPDNAYMLSPPRSPKSDIRNSFVPDELAHLQSINEPAPTNLFQPIMDPEAGTLDRMTSNGKKPCAIGPSLAYNPLNRVQSPKDRKTPNLLKAPSFPRVYLDIPPCAPLTSPSSTPDPIAIKDFAPNGGSRIYENFETESNISIDQRTLSPDGTVASSLFSRPELEASRSTPVSSDRKKSIRRQPSISALRIGPYTGLAGVEYDPAGHVRVIPAREDSHHSPSPLQADPREADSSGNASDESLSRPSRFEERLELDGVALYGEDDGAVVEDRSLFKRLKLCSKSRRSGQCIQRARDVDANGSAITVTELEATDKTERKSGIRWRLGEWWKKMKERFEKKEMQ